jgi:protease-4
MANYLSQRWHSDRWGNLPVIVVVHARGGIAAGGSPFGKGVNGRQIAEILSDLRVDRRVDAVVLRVNSPGGTILGSDLIWREMVRLKAHKPVIVSMGPVAASGGYYISCAASSIVANAATITGSIGVLVMFWDLSELFGKLGISHAVVKRGAHADIGSLHRGRSPEEMALLEKVVKADYQNFIERVADGRQMDISRVDAVGQGRVWTGRQAKEKGLVDELGGLTHAITLARQKAGLSPDEEVRIVHLPRARFSLGRLLQELGVTTEEAAIFPQAVRASLGQMAWLSTMSAEPVVALLPFLITIK